MQRHGVTALVLCVLLVGLTFVGSLWAAKGVAADPLTGTWKVARGGSGTFLIARRGSVLGFIAKTAVKLGCVRRAKGDVVGFAELPSNTRLPKGVYSAGLGVTGTGCSYTVRLKLSGKTASGRIVYNEDGGRAGPFVFTRA